MIQQLLYVDPIRRILLQTLVQEIPRLARHEHVRRNTDLILDYLYQLLLLRYLERILTHHHLVHHYTQ